MDLCWGYLEAEKSLTIDIMRGDDQTYNRHFQVEKGQRSHSIAAKYLLGSPFRVIVIDSFMGPQLWSSRLMQARADDQSFRLVSEARLWRISDPTATGSDLRLGVRLSRSTPIELAASSVRVCFIGPPEAGAVAICAHIKVRLSFLFFIVKSPLFCIRSRNRLAIFNIACSCRLLLLWPPSTGCACRNSRRRILFWRLPRLLCCN